ncbi:MAG: T9SS type A sorting domain-containing protein [Bacteroidota bacterium]
MGTLYRFGILLTAITCLSAGVVSAQTRDGNFWIPNNSVNSIIVDDSRNIVLLGGNFTYLGLNTGSAAMVNKSTGLYDQTFPMIENGSISAAVSDGSGGLFIGGSFTSVGGVTRNNLAHITSSGILSSWNPDPNGSVYSLAIAGGILYVGGDFTMIDGQNDTCLASFDVATKTYNAAFQPNPITGSGYASVSQLLAYGSKLYVIGGYTAVGDSARNGAAALDAATGTLDQWNPATSDWGNEPNGMIKAMVPCSGKLIAGGTFTVIGGSYRRAIAQIDTVDGTATSWDAGIDPYIYAGMFGSDTSATIYSLFAKGDTLYVGGNFQGFQSNASPSLAALACSTAAFISGVLPAMESGSYINSFDVDGSTMYIGGNYRTIGGEQRNNISAVNTGTGSVLSWNPNTSGSVYSIVASGTQVFIGGDFYSVNGAARYGLAAVDQSTGVPTSWNPNFHSTDAELMINAMSLVDTVLYVGGRFTNFAEQSRSSLAAVGISGGGVVSFNPSLISYDIFSGASTPEIHTMASDGNKLYVGGQFDTVDAQKRPASAAFTLSSGALSSWNPNLSRTGSSPSVSAIAVAGNRVFLGGSAFEMAGDSLRNNLAAVDTGTGTAYAWYPSSLTSGNYIYKLILDGSTLYVGGSFGTIGGVTRNNAAAFDTSGITPTAWNPDLDSTPNDIAVSSSNVYIGGFFQFAGGVERHSIVAVDKTTGAASSWDPQIDAGNQVESIGISPAHQKIYFGGDFSTVLAEFSPQFAAVTNPFDGSLPVELASFTASVRGNGAELSWKTAAETNNYGFEIEKKAVSSWPLANSQQLNANDWSKIGFVEGNGTTNSPKSYSFVDGSVRGTTVYRLKQIDRDGKFQYSQQIEITVGRAPQKYALGQNYPNPFNPSTVISYQLPMNSYVTLKVYDMIGKEIATLVNGMQEAGAHTTSFNASHLPSGLYFYSLQSKNFSDTKKMLLVK